MTKVRYLNLYILAAMTLLNILIAPVMDSDAEMYKYKKDGVWCYTDTPPEGLSENSQKEIQTIPSISEGIKPGATLLENFPTRNDIEKAAAATVAIKSAMGSGSGFFISDAGHIITNKHVVRSMPQRNHQTQAHFEKIDRQIESYDQKFAEERARLRAFRQRLDGLKITADKEHQAQRRQSYQQEYQVQRQKYEEWQADFDRRQQAYESEKKEFRDKRHNYEYSKSVADLSQSFTVILADQTKLYAHLVKVSSKHDLALLKVDGYTTPSLTIQNTNQLAQSTPVYAIGNPLNLQNSVTSGVFSGFEKGFLQTNAQIYPGNSGGPLVDAKGNVLGINTFKQITYKFEGLGFAIPIETALEEFRTFLPNR